MPVSRVLLEHSRTCPCRNCPWLLLPYNCRGEWPWDSRACGWTCWMGSLPTPDPMNMHSALLEGFYTEIQLFHCSPESVWVWMISCLSIPASVPSLLRMGPGSSTPPVGNSSGCFFAADCSGQCHINQRLVLTARAQREGTTAWERRLGPHTGPSESVRHISLNRMKVV